MTVVLKLFCCANTVQWTQLMNRDRGREGKQATRPVRENQGNIYIRWLAFNCPEWISWSECEVGLKADVASNLHQL